MNGSQRQSVCVIGAGVAGLVSAKVLQEDGFEVTVFEREPDLGGVWASSRAYPGLRTNNPREAYAFSDFAHPQASDEFPRAGQVRSYLDAYAAHFNLLPRLRLATEVESVRRSGDGFAVVVRSAGASTGSQQHGFDRVVVCNGVFSTRRLPRFDGEDAFEGEIWHSSQFRDLQDLTGKRVLVVGAGKSALDCASAAAETAESTTLVFRRPHWMLPRYFGSRRVDEILFNRLSEYMLPAYHRIGWGEFMMRKLGLPLLPLLWWQRRRLQRVVARINRMPETMQPAEPVHEHIPTLGIGTPFFTALAEQRAQAIAGRVSALAGGRQVCLADGRKLVADVVILATGWHQGVPFLERRLASQVQDQRGRFRLYRHILPPGERGLGFIGYASSTNCPLTSEVAAHWLSQSFRGELTLPDAERMQREIDRVQRWANKTFPREHAGFFIGPYVAHYIDELLADMDLPARREDRFSRELLGPLWAQRYRGLAEERRRRRTD